MKGSILKKSLTLFFSLFLVMSCGKKSKDGNDYQTGYETGYQNGANRVCKRFKATLADSDWDYHAPKECRQN